ncbi:hypothetical protein LCGC14_1296650 [marine sediment metagenome]|uniref:AAA+ ATPase domain-containing protein n=1 Tax=marine sediment metagenome TaxID=412755 RepID=A0A0F9NTQ4_9ZZZZ|nr:AAA family ATPase [Pricia sp.]
MTLLKERLIKHIKRITRPAYLMGIPMNIVDFFIKKLIIYSSYVLYYPYWLWRKKTIRNALIWLAILSALIVEFFTVAVLLQLFGIAANFAISAMMMIGQFLLMFTFLSNTENIEMLPGDTGSKNFKDHWYGQEHIKEVVLGTIEMMSPENKAKMDALGATPPAGAMLTGQPGTGKTLIAMCTASEVGIPYIGLNGADFNAMFIGVGEMKVKGVVSKARKWANQYGGCIVFIDEADAVMMSRGGTEGDENRPVQQGGGIFGGGMGIRSQLLTGMDGTQEPAIRTDLINFFFRFFGFEEMVDGVVFWLGATNRISMIDGAFLRPGRMDVIIQMDPPDRGSRRKIIQGYVDKVTTDDTVDVERLTDDTQGLTPADAAGAIERVAARFTIKDGRDAISHADIEDAILEQMLGIANPIAEFEEGQKEQVATHEAGHAVVLRVLLPKRRITNLSIVRRGKGMLGFMRNVAPEEIYAMPLEDLGAQIQLSWAGDIACEIVLGKRWTGAYGGTQSDLATVINLMRMIANHGWFADKLPLDPDNPFEDEEIQKAAHTYHKQMKDGTRSIINEYRELVVDLRDNLIEHGELNSAETLEILEEYGL